MMDQIKQDDEFLVVFEDQIQQDYINICNELKSEDNFTKKMYLESLRKLNVKEK